MPGHAHIPGTPSGVGWSHREHFAHRLPRRCRSRRATTPGHEDAPGEGPLHDRDLLDGAWWPRSRDPARELPALARGLVQGRAGRAQADPALKSS
ncbi:DUF5994 family protein [Streptomyces formicae]|uniref:DUF5994 family protein n=1 Tax=Streptomyces formicae TaxID=1616117 RepID=UPI001F565D68|nr:DUF5994 family protein [Streptomyces formicae]